MPPSLRAVVERLALPFVAYSPRPSPGSPLLLEPYSLAVGVGHITASGKLCEFRFSLVGPLWSRATGVGHDEEALSLVGRSDVGGGDDTCVHVIPGGIEIGDNDVQPARNEGRNVLDDDEPRAELADDAGILSPEAGAGVVEAGALARVREPLAGEAAADDVDPLELRRPDCSDIAVPLRVRPVFRKYAPAPRVLLDLPDRVTDAGPFEPEL